MLMFFFLRNPEALNNLWKLREEFTDATIFADNSKFGIRVHKFILAAASPYFRVKLKKRRTVRLPEFSQDDLQMILEYIYKGNIQITADKFERFQEKAKLLSIDIQITRRKGNTSFETSLEPVLKPVLKPALKLVLKPVLKLVQKPVLIPVLKPALKLVLKRVQKPALKPVLKPALKLVLKPVLKPVLNL